jgi:nitrate reductase cytochrome c-type subunit
MDKKKCLLIGFFLSAFLAVVTVSVIFGGAVQTAEPAESILVQLEEEGYPDAATMVLLGAPPTQPADHIDRWVPELRHQGCMTCHGSGASPAPTPPADHFYEEDQDGPIFRDNCIQCHATQNDKKAAFNSD